MVRGVDGAKVRLWRERFVRFDDGEMKVEDFGLAEGISKSSFYHWRRKLASSKRPSAPIRKRQERKTERGAFEPVTIAAAAMVVIDAVVRLLPGGLGSEDSPVDESFSHGLLEYPQYTRPREFDGMVVPEVLVSGDHAKIEAFRRSQAQSRTEARRPDLLTD